MAGITYPLPVISERQSYSGSREPKWHALHPNPDAQNPFLKAQTLLLQASEVPSKQMLQPPTDIQAGLLLPAHPGAALRPSTRGRNRRRRWQRLHRSMAQNARSQAVLVLTADRSQLSLGTRTPRCQQLSVAQLHAERCRCGGTSACQCCLLFGGRYCVPLATLAAQRPQLAPAPRSSSRLLLPAHSHQGETPPHLHLGRGV